MCFPNYYKKLFLHQSLFSVALFGSLGLLSTAWLKYFAVVSHNFTMILTMQALCAISHIFLSAIQSKLSAWFPRNEECFVSGVNIFCNNSGIILNFISLMTINSSGDMTIVSRDLRSFMFVTAIFSTFLAITVTAIAFPSEEPKHPPSYFEALKRELIIQSNNKSFSKALKILMTNKNFIMLAIGFGLQLGIFNAFSTLVNSIILHYFPVRSGSSINLKLNNYIRCLNLQNSQVEAGTICFIISLLSVLGLFGFAYSLAKYCMYKQTAMWILRLQSITFILFSLSLESKSFFVMCGSSALLG